MNQSEVKPNPEQREAPAACLGADLHFEEAIPWILLILIILTVVVDLFFFTGFYSSDDIEYYEFARQWWLNGRYSELSTGDYVAAQRLVIIGWNRLMIGLLGPNPQAVAATFVVFHLALILLTYALAKRVFVWKVGLVAAYFTALAPPFIHYSTTILPDIPLAFFFVLSLYAFMRSYDKASGQPPSAWWMLLCGLAVGWAYQTKESGLILLPFYFFLWLAMSRGRRIKTVFGFGVLFLLGVAIVFAYDLIVLSYLYNRSFMRLSWTVQSLDPAIREHIGRYGLHPLQRLGWVKLRINEFAYFIPWWGKWCLLAMLFAYPFIKRSRLPIAAMLIWIFVYHTWGSMRLKEYFPPSIQARYYICALPFGIIMLAFVIYRATEQARRIPYVAVRRGISSLTIAVFLILPLPGLRVADEKAGKAYRASTIANVSAAIRFAREQSKLPLVVSAYVQHRMCYLYQDAHLDGLLQANDLTVAALQSLLRQSGFYYVETDKQAFESATITDVCLHSASADRLSLPFQLDPALNNQAWPLSVNLETMIDPTRLMELPTASWSTTHGIVGYFFTGTFKAAVHDVGWFTQPKTRSAEARWVWGRNILPNRYIDQRDAHSVHLLRVVPISEKMDHDSSNKKLNALPLTRAVALDLKPDNWAILGRSKAAKNGTDGESPICHIEKIDGKLRVLLANDARDYEWLTLRGPWTPKTLKLETGGDYEFIIESELKDAAKAELRLGVFADLQHKQRIFEKRIDLRSGRARFAISADSRSVYFKPDFKLVGHGSFTLVGFTIQRIR